MIKRVIDISQPSYLKMSRQQLCIERPNLDPVTLPIEDLGVLVLAHPQITLTQAVMQASVEHNVALVHCNHQHLPTGITLPLAHHSLHSKVLQQQMALKKVRQKQLWQQIVSEKISQQGQTLKRLGREYKAVQNKAKQVKSGDSANHEAQAAKAYWPLLMGKQFKRQQDQAGVNAVLNYGYSIVRAVCARALVATGFHPAIGLKHCNQYNSHALADDVMEVYRPWVDERVFHLHGGCVDDELEVTPAVKQCLLSMLSDTVRYQQQDMPFMVALQQWMAHFKQAYPHKQPLQFIERGRKH